MTEFAQKKPWSDTPSKVCHTQSQQEENPQLLTGKCSSNRLLSDTIFHTQA